MIGFKIRYIEKQERKVERKEKENIYGGIDSYRKYEENLQSG